MSVPTFTARPRTRRVIAIVTLAGALRVNLKLVPRGALAVTAVERGPTRKRVWVIDTRLMLGAMSGTTVTL